MSPHTSQNGHIQNIYKCQMLARVWRKGNPSTLFLGMQVRTAIAKNSMEVPSKIKQSEHMIQQSHSWACIGENHNSKRYMYPNIHGSAIYNTQDRETT